MDPIDSTAFLTPLMAREGVLTKREPTEDERADLTFGYGIADVIAGMDIGQAIAVKSVAVVAVEAMEGTDQVIAGWSARWRRRDDREGGEAEPGHAFRRAGHRRGDDSGHAGRRCIDVVGGCGKDTDD